MFLSTSAEAREKSENLAFLRRKQLMKSHHYCPWQVCDLP